MNTPRLFSMLLLLVFIITGARGQDNKTGRDITGAGGGSSGDGKLVIHTSVGQPAVGDIIIGSTMLQQGFWFHSARGSASLTSMEHPTTGLSLVMQAQPNPFSASTTLLVNIPVAGHVTAQLHTMQGVALLTLIDGIYQAGMMSITVDGTHLPSGNYVVMLAAGEWRAATTLRLVK